MKNLEQSPQRRSLLIFTFLILYFSNLYIANLYFVTESREAQSNQKDEHKRLT